ncbi:MAG: STAS domain-containing protein [Actinomycetota bacterium]
MDLSVTKSDASVRLTLAGRIDALESPELSRLIDDHLADEPPHLVVDLYRVDYVDSAGLAVLVRVWRTQQTANRRFSLVMPESEAAKRIFSLAGFDQIFETEDAPADSLN